MGKNRDLTSLEVLGIAIKSEIEAIKLYDRMKELVKHPDLVAKLDFLLSQERRHEEILTEAYKSKFPDTKLQLPAKSLVPSIGEVLSGETDLKVLFNVAMKAEKISEEFYSKLAENTRDSNSKSLLLYLASMERSHYAILEAEYRQLEMGVDLDSDDILRGDRLMNLGP